ncbi:MAG: sugar phosphate isomerase/epimerase family protein [bacterium]|nr:sugar phosphate isomerase/epimerase family protein [bacterium]
MKISINLLLFLMHLKLSHRKLLGDLKRCGADGVEVPIFEGTPDHYERVGAMIREIWPDGPITAVSMVAPDADPSSPNAQVRKRGVALLKSRIDCASALGAEALVGPFTSPWALWPKRRGKTLSGDALIDEMQRRIALAVPCLREVATYGREKRGIVEVATEYLNPWELPFVNTFPQAAAFVDAVSHPNLGILFDTAHEAAGAGTKAFYHAVKRYLESKGYLRAHISSPYTRGDIVDSAINWELIAVLKSLGWKGNLVVEMFNAKPPFAEGARLNRRPWSMGQCLDRVRAGISFTREQWERASGSLWYK